MLPILQLLFPADIFQVILSLGKIKYSQEWQSAARSFGVLSCCWLSLLAGLKTCLARYLYILFLAATYLLDQNHSEDVLSVRIVQHQQHPQLLRNCFLFHSYSVRIPIQISVWSCLCRCSLVRSCLNNC